ncbi:MAG: DUF2497 domain-containing protein [Holosporales bacterium]|jgi:cell pole-organizing protein PopZ
MAVAAIKEEPSMEEILASIRRIISEQDAPPAAAPSGEAYARAVEATDDVLELTTVVNDDGTLSEIGQADFLVDEQAGDTSFSAALAEQDAAATVLEAAENSAAPTNEFALAETAFEPSFEAAPTEDATAESAFAAIVSENTDNLDNAGDFNASDADPFASDSFSSGEISIGAGFDEDTSEASASADPFASSESFNDAPAWDAEPAPILDSPSPFSSTLDDAFPSAPAAPEPVAKAAPSRPAPQTNAFDEDADMALLSPAAIAASVQSLAELQRAQERQQQGDTTAALGADFRVANTPGSPTLEDLTRQMLKPLLQDWLNSNLPDIVERIVRDEVERLTKKV